ncbi:2-amino-4-hydroxy-6-hydroxymethyldihydropteridine diphosphokinase [Dongia soli]|uniref:2-amino-4-hydroxy-6-hydroxymethyldihydropteridine pyrophosphokinase n=1 Tax=Dongia soli TaxID=600628 RepID=A0ABU5EDK2_9PROT|nr:2-amino-4-hydroxy-6-hydroxymethyldihydropteridine diphosphokinase [Dongia soli]MDY0884130.1 2-amino-4-hydroxy-6-hydroxymethyldihydropteridine diphosphokinase [Dongia soli]
MPGHDLSYVGLGANLTHPTFGPPVATLDMAVAALVEMGLMLVAKSPWYESAPVPLADQPWYVNGVVALRSSLNAVEMLQRLHEVEARFGRVRSVVNAPRVVDLDLLDHHGEIRDGETPPILPHPRLAARGFVLLPLRDIAPHWHHPVTQQGVAELILALPQDQVARPLS